MTNTPEQPQTATFDSLLRLAEEADVLLKFALFLVMLWPLAPMIAAMIFHGSKAQTIVPIIDLIPLGAVLALVLDAPFGLVTLLKEVELRKGFVFLLGVIGVELAIGVFLTIIPISSDNGLVPLLMLTALALLFLSLGSFARTLRILLTIAVVVITFIFVEGGRDKISHDLTHAFTNVTKENFSNQNIASFTVPLASDSWTQEITFPRVWNGFNLTINRNFDDSSPEASWFAFRCSGAAGQLIDVGTVYKAGQTYPSALFNSCTGPIQFRGHSNLLIEKTQPTRGEDPGPVASKNSTSEQKPNDPNATATSPSQTAAVPATDGQPKTQQPVQPSASEPAKAASSPAPPPPPQPKQFEPDWTKSQKMARGDFVTQVSPCILRAANLHCFFKITNQGSDFRLWLVTGGDSRIVDDAGAMYKPYAIHFGNNQLTQGGDLLLPSGVTVAGSIVFENFTGSQIQVFDLVFQDARNTLTKFQFHNLAVQQEGQP